MILVDVNVLVYAHRKDAVGHLNYLKWMEGVLSSEQSFGMSSLVLSSFIRLVTNARVFPVPTSLKDALAFTQEIRSRPNCVLLQPGPRHWEIFINLCELVQAKGNLIPDAFLAALAIETGSEWITTDRDFSRFKGLRSRHPLAA